MARVTIERLLNQCESRFEAVFLASYLAQEVVNGKSFDINTDNKYAVIALRLIECGKVSVPELRETVLKRCVLDCQVNTAKNSSIIEENFDNSNSNNNADIGININDIMSSGDGADDDSIISQGIDINASVCSIEDSDDSDE